MAFLPFYIKTLELVDGNNVVLSRIEPDVPVSENPVFSLDFDMTPGQKITLTGQDNNGNRINEVIYDEKIKLSHINTSFSLCYENLNI